MEELTETEFAVYTEKNRAGMNTTTERKLRPLDGESEDDSDVVRAVNSLLAKTGSTQLRHILRYMGLEEGDRVTLDELLAFTPEKDHATRVRFGSEDIAREIDLLNLDVTESFSPGDIVEVRRAKRDPEPGEVERGVIRSVESRGGSRGDRAEITWDGHTYSHFKTIEDTGLRLGRASMMGLVWDVRVVDPDEVDDEELLDLRESALASADLDERAAELTVETEKRWESSGAVEASRASDLHARVTVSGGPLAEPVSVHCRNIFDFGWTANVDGDDLDDDTERLVIRAARNNSPIPTGVRL